MSGRGIRRAFVLGAGKGTRLLPLTESLPKPLVPIVHKPLISFAFDHLLATGARELIVNTHHAAEAYGRWLPASRYADVPVTLRHELVLLETGGGIKNVEDLAHGETLCVYNGDVLADFALAEAVERHFRQGNAVTLVLRREGGPRQVRYNERSGQVEDFRDAIGGSQALAFVFAGIYLVEPVLFSFLKRGEIVSVVPAFLEMIRRGLPIGAYVAEEGFWHDLGTIERYREISLLAARGEIAPSYKVLPDEWPSPIHADAAIAPSARLLGTNIIGAGAEVGADAEIEDCIVWPGAKIASGSQLKRCIVRAYSAGAWSDCVA